MPTRPIAASQTVPATSADRTLPPGQHVAPHARFGLPRSARRTVRLREPWVVMVAGEVRHPVQLTVADLSRGLPRVERTTDLHCVTTWSAVDLCWSGVPFAAALRRIAAVARPRDGCRWLGLGGLDGYRCCLRIDHATRPGVLLADRLSCQDLDVARGGPVRLVTPDHYGYKSVKHLVMIEYRTRYRSGSAGWKEHPTARVDREERSRGLPGRVWRPIWSALEPTVRRSYRLGDPPRVPRRR